MQYIINSAGKKVVMDRAIKGVVKPVDTVPFWWDLDQSKAVVVVKGHKYYDVIARVNSKTIGVENAISTAIDVIKKLESGNLTVKTARKVLKEYLKESGESCEHNNFIAMCNECEFVDPIKEKLKRAIDKVPCLTDEGANAYRHTRGKTQNDRFLSVMNSRAFLIFSTKDFIMACKWIKDNLQKRKTINKNISSYELKHVMERDTKTMTESGYYVTNGIFIAAAVHCGFDTDVEKGRFNPSINVSQKSLTKLWRLPIGH